MQLILQAGELCNFASTVPPFFASYTEPDDSHSSILLCLAQAHGSTSSYALKPCCSVEKPNVNSNNLVVYHHDENDGLKLYRIKGNGDFYSNPIRVAKKPIIRTICEDGTLEFLDRGGAGGAYRFLSIPFTSSVAEDQYMYDPWINVSGYGTSIPFTEMYTLFPKFTSTIIAKTWDKELTEVDSLQRSKFAYFKGKDENLNTGIRYLLPHLKDKKNDTHVTGEKKDYILYALHKISEVEHNQIPLNYFMHYIIDKQKGWAFLDIFFNAVTGECYLKNKENDFVPISSERTLFEQKKNNLINQGLKELQKCTTDFHAYQEVIKRITIPYYYSVKLDPSKKFALVVPSKTIVQSPFLFYDLENKKCYENTVDDRIKNKFFPLNNVDKKLLDTESTFDCVFPKIQFGYYYSCKESIFKTGFKRDYSWKRIFISPLYFFVALCKTAWGTLYRRSDDGSYSFGLRLRGGIYSDQRSFSIPKGCF